MTKLVRSFVLLVLRVPDVGFSSSSSSLDKMKQYLEQLRKECSDRMVDRVIDPETDKPSKVGRRC